MKHARLLVIPFLVVLGFTVGAQEQDIRLSDVWLYNSGVGLFTYNGTVSGNSTFTLSFDREEMADIVRSLIVRDLDGGTVSISRYDAAEDLNKRLSRYPVNLSGNTTFIGLLQQLRGNHISVFTVDGDRVTGQLLTAEAIPTTKSVDGNDRFTLGILTTAGLQLLAEHSILRIVPQDDLLGEELSAALDVLADSGSDSRRDLHIEFSGTGERRISISYLRPVPVWKTSYRVALDEEDALIQGWAHIDNTSAEDWMDVRLNLVSGSPSSFFIDLYTAIYRDRPRITYETGPAVVAPAYNRTSDRAERSASVYSEMAAPTMDFDDSLSLGEGVHAQATAENTSVFSVYRIDERSSIPRSSSAMIPVIQETVPIERVSVFDQNVLSNRSLAGFRFSNESGVLMPAGPMTILDGSAYGGDSRILSIPPGEERLVTFAVDLRTSIEVDSSVEPEELVSMRIVDGVMEVHRRQEKTSLYTLTNSNDLGETLILMHPVTSGWELIRPTEDTRTGDSHQFDVSLQPGATRTVQIVERRSREERVTVLNMNDSQIGFYVSQRFLSPALRRALENVRQLQSRLQSTEQTRRTLESERSSIFNDQARIRSNMAGLDHDSALYRRYSTTLNRQEDRILELEDELETAQREEETARDALTEYVRTLSAD